MTTWDKVGTVQDPWHFAGTSYQYYHFYSLHLLFILFLWSLGFYFVPMISWISYWLLTITFTISYHWTDVLVLHLNIYTFFGRLLIYYIDLSLILGFNTMSTSESRVSIIQSGANKSFNLCYNVFLDIYVETIENKYSMMYYICP